MEVTTAAPKRTRAKADTPAAMPKPKAAAVKPRASRKPTAKTPAAEAASMIVAAEPIDLTDMIATTAYFLAAERHFTPGHELADWLEAERRVHAQYNG